MYKDIFELVVAEENRYNSIPIQVTEGWDWNMKTHINETILYKYSQLTSGKNKGKADEKPVKNIIRPILNLAYRAEDIDVKDINIYVDDPSLYHLSLLVKKYHDDVFVIENDLDTFFDELKESKIDFGGGLSKYLYSPRPERVFLESIAFCDQTNLLAGVFTLKHDYTPAELLDMASFGWGDKAKGATATLEEVVELSKNSKHVIKTGRTTITTSKNIEVYEIHGQMPLSFLEEGGDENKYIGQLHIICFYNDTKDHKKGITLFKGKEKKLPFKFINRDQIYNRALGFGGAEELFEPQVWTNYSEIKKKEMLDAAAKTILKTTDTSFANRNKIMDMDNLEIAVLEEGKDIGQIDTFPRNFTLFEKAVNEWESHAQRMGSATDPLLGESPAAGTPFRLQERVVVEGKGIHEYRKGKYAKHIEEIYKDWILPYIVKKITQGTRFLSELSLDELQYVADCVVRNKANKFVIEKILNGELVFPEDVETYKQQVRDEFMRGGNKKFIEILKGEFANLPLKVKVNVSGKQKNLALITDKLVNIFRQIIMAPQVLDDPRMAKIFTKIIEYSGLDPADFTSYTKPTPQIQAQSVQPMPIPEMNRLPVPA